MKAWGRVQHFLVAWVVLFLAVPGWGSVGATGHERGASDVKAKVDAIADKINDKSANTRSRGEAALYQIDCSPAGDVEPKTAELKEPWLRFRHECFRYLADALNQRTRSLDWQHFSTKVIFWAVLGLVVIGVLFSWLQFRRVIGTKKGESTGIGGEIEVAMTGFRIASPVLGVLILGLSLGFFYLYLQFVYPIIEIK